MPLEDKNDAPYDSQNDRRSYPKTTSQKNPLDSDYASESQNQSQEEL